MSTHAPHRRRRAVVWNMSAGALLVLGNLGTVGLGVRIAGAGDYGVWAIAFALVTLLVQADLGLATSIVRHASITRHRGDRLATARIAAAGMLTMGALVLLLPALQAIGLVAYFAVSGGAGAALETAVVVGATAVLVASLATRYLTAIAHSAGSFHPERIAAVAGTVLRLVLLGLVLAVGGGSIAHVVLIEVLGFVVTLVGITAYCVRAGLLTGTWHHGRPTRADVTALLRFGTPTFGSGVLTLLATQAPLYVVGAILGFRDAAVFAAISRVYQSARTVIFWLTGPYLPASAAESAAGPGRLRVLHAELLGLSGVLACVMSIVLAVAADDVLVAWLGETAPGAGIALAIVSLAIVVNALYSPGEVIAVGAGRPGTALVPALVICVLTLALCPPLTLEWGLVGAALSIAVPVAVVFPFAQARVVRVTGVDSRRAYRVVAACAGIAVAVAMVVERGAHAIALPEAGTVVLLALAVGCAGGGAYLVLRHRLTGADVAESRV